MLPRSKYPAPLLSARPSPATGRKNPTLHKNRINLGAFSRSQHPALYKNRTTLGIFSRSQNPALYKNRTNLGVFSPHNRTTRRGLAARGRGGLGARGIVFRGALVAPRGAQGTFGLVPENAQTPLSLLLQVSGKVWVSLHLALGGCMRVAVVAKEGGGGGRRWRKK